VYLKNKQIYTFFIFHFYLLFLLLEKYPAKKICLCPKQFILNQKEMEHIEDSGSEKKKTTIMEKSKIKNKKKF
jgi:hypothetical protein